MPNLQPTQFMRLMVLCSSLCYFTIWILFFCRGRAVSLSPFDSLLLSREHCVPSVHIKDIKFSFVSRLYSFLVVVVAYKISRIPPNCVPIYISSEWERSCQATERRRRDATGYKYIWRLQIADAYLIVIRLTEQA